MSRANEQQVLYSANVVADTNFAYFKWTTNTSRPTYLCLFPPDNDQQLSIEYLRQSQRSNLNWLAIWAPQQDVSLVSWLGNQCNASRGDTFRFILQIQPTLKVVSCSRRCMENWRVVGNTTTTTADGQTKLILTWFLTHSSYQLY